jgi:hypothetical protein
MIYVAVWALLRGLFPPSLYFRLAVGFGLLGVVLAAATSPAKGAVALGIRLRGGDPAGE